MMMMMINSTILESDSDKRLCLLKPQHDLVISENFDDINNNHYEAEKSLLECNNTMKQDILSSNDHENNTTLLTTTTTTTTVEFKVKTTKTSSRKRKLNLMNDINHDNIHKQQAITKKKKKQRVTKQDHNDQKKNHSKTVDQSSGTDESSFGSCEPGTSVVLQGIVWNETDKGVLVVNITWRGKTYVGALLNTTEQNWAPPRYKSDIRSIKPNPNRDHQLPSIPSTHESTERILRNGKRRGSSATVTPSSTTKTRSFKIPETPPPSSKADETLTTNEKLIVPPSRNMNEDDETGDNDSSRSVSPTTSGISTTSSSPPLSNNNENSSLSNPVDLSNSKTKDPLIPYHFPNDLLFSTSTNSSDYFSSTNSFNLSLSSTSSTVSPSSYCPIPSEIYFNSLPSVSSLSKSSH